MRHNLSLPLDGSLTCPSAGWSYGVRRMDSNSQSFPSTRIMCDHFFWRRVEYILDLKTCQILYCPTNVLNDINCRVIKKHIKNVKSAPTCFGSCRNHHQGAKVSAHLKLQYGSTVLVDVSIVSVMAAYATVTLTALISTSTVEPHM